MCTILAERPYNELARRSRSTLLPHERALLLERTPAMLDVPPALPLALPHLRWLRVAVLAGGRSVPRRLPSFFALVAPFQIPDAARGLQRRLEVICRTSPNLAASSAYGRAFATWWRQNFEIRKKTRVSPSSHIVLAAFLHGHRTPRAKRAPSQSQSSCFSRSSPALPVLPGYSSGCRSA